MKKFLCSSSVLLISMAVFGAEIPFIPISRWLLCNAAQREQTLRETNYSREIGKIPQISLIPGKFRYFELYLRQPVVIAQNARELPALFSLDMLVSPAESLLAVSVRLKDASGEIFQYKQHRDCKLRPSVWRKITIPLDTPSNIWSGNGDKKLDYPVSFVGLAIEFDERVSGKCEVLLDQLAYPSGHTETLQKPSHFLVGATTHFIQGKGEVPRNLSLAAQAGLNSIRDEVSWATVERRKGVLQVPKVFDSYVNEARKHGISPLITLDYGNPLYDDGNYPVTQETMEGFTRYCETIVRHAAGRVTLFQIWNEWDGGCGMNWKKFGRGKAEAYVKLLKTVYPRLKKIAPAATIIANPACSLSWLEETFKLGMLDYCDAIAFHSYNYSKKGTPEKWLEQMEQLRQLIHHYNSGQDKDLYITEMGWPTHIHHTGTAESTAALYLAKLYLYGSTLPFLKGIWWYDLQDDGWNFRERENNFGLLRADLTPKDAYYAMKSIAAHLGTGEFIGATTVEGGRVLRFRNGTEEFCAVINSDATQSDLRLILEKTDSAMETVTLEAVGREPVKLPWGHREWVDNRQAKADMRQLSVIVGENPVFLSGKFRISRSERLAFPRDKRPQGRQLWLPFRHAPISRDYGTEVPLSHYTALVAKEKSPNSDNFNASFRGCYDRDQLQLIFTVQDDVMHQPEKNISDAWRGDSIQVAFQAFDAKGMASFAAFDAALVSGKPELLIRKTANPTAGRPTCAIKRENTATVYQLTIPAACFGLKAFEPGMVLGSAFLVNDNDGAGRRGFLSWGGGIGTGEYYPEEFYLLTLQ